MQPQHRLGHHPSSNKKTKNDTKKTTHTPLSPTIATGPPGLRTNSELELHDLTNIITPFINVDDVDVPATVVVHGLPCVDGHSGPP